MPLRHTIMVDASYDYGRRTIGIGLVIHETDKPGRNGVVIDQLSEAYVGVPSGEGERFAILRALEVASQRGYRNVKVRSDCNQVRTKLKKLHEKGAGRDGNDLESIILRLAVRFDELRFAYQRRRKNQEAHRLARRGARDGEPIAREHGKYLHREE